MIEDEDEDVYQVPEDVFPRPDTPEFSTLSDSMFTFSFQNEPFSFSISRKDTDEVLFNTTGSNLVFQDQYLNLRTSLPEDPNLYGLGEHTDPFRLNTTDYVRTLWNRDAYGIAPGTNLYGDHPIYVDHRGKSGTHGVFFLNSNGMDIMIDKDDEGQQYLEYNTLGGVFDFYFFSGPTPKEVAQQYAEVAGLPAMIPYWGFGVRPLFYPSSSHDFTVEVRLTFFSFTIAAMGMKMHLRLAKWCTIIAKPVFPWRPFGRISTTWMADKSSRLTRNGTPSRRCAPLWTISMITTSITSSWSIRL